MISAKDSRSQQRRAGGSMSFEFGVFHEFPRYAGVTDAEAFTQSFAQVDAAERWGLDVK